MKKVGNTTWDCSSFVNVAVKNQGHNGVETFLREHTTPSPRITWFPLLRFTLTHFLASVCVSGGIFFYQLSHKNSLIQKNQFLLFQGTKMRVSQGIGVLVLLQLPDILQFSYFECKPNSVSEISIEHLAMEKKSKQLRKTKKQST